MAIEVFFSRFEGAVDEYRDAIDRGQSDGVDHFRNKVNLFPVRALEQGDRIKEQKSSPTQILMNTETSLEVILNLAKQLSPFDKVRLVEQISNQLEHDRITSRKSLRGLWKRVDVTEADIAALRQDMWQNFLREDI